MSSGPLARLDRTSLIGLAALVVAGVFVVAGFGGLIGGLFAEPQTRTVRATFDESKQLLVGGPVRIDGVDVGEVERIAADADAGTAVVTMKLVEDAGPLYEDASASLRWRTVLGGAFYVDLERGTASRGPLAAAGIPADRTEHQVELDDVTEIIRGDAERGLRTLPGELAKALEEPREPKRLLGELGDASPDAAAGLNALRGIAEDRDLRDLVSNTASTVRSLDSPTGELRTIIAGAASTLGTTGGRQEEIRQAVALSPPVMRDTETTLDRLETTLDVVDPLLARLRGPADDVAPTVDRLRPTVLEGDRLLRDARPLLQSLRPASASLRGAARSGLPLLRRLEPSLDRVDETILPMLSEKDPQTTKSTAVMIGGTFLGLASGAGGQMDSLGHFIRFPATAGNSSVYSLPCQSYFANPDKPEVVACQSFEEALNTYLNYDPFGPTRGSVDDGGGEQEGG